MVRKTKPKKKMPYVTKLLIEYGSKGDVEPSKIFTPRFAYKVVNMMWHFFFFKFSFLFSFPFWGCFMDDLISVEARVQGVQLLNGFAHEDVHHVV